MRLRATTRLLAVVGDPVEHSLSPAMHNAAIRALGLDAAYLAIRVGHEEFAATATVLLGAGAALNVTVPHKRAAAALPGVEYSDAARRTGACNTLWRDGARLAGDNTDVAAVASEAGALPGEGAPPVRRAVVIGTGGSARAAAVAVAGRWPGAQVEVVSRDAGRAGEFARWASGAGIACRAWSAGESAPGALVVNATPLGLKGSDPLPMDEAVLRRLRPAAVLDLVYARGGTPLVSRCRALGIAAADGRGVLVAQGAAAFVRFFGVAAPVEVMRAAVEDALRP